MRTFLIADDHALFRAGLRLTLHLRADTGRIVEAVDGQEAVAVAERERPDVAILDVGMPRLNGIDAARRILEGTPACKVVMLSQYGDHGSVAGAFREGAVAYVLKASPVSELHAALAALDAGKPYLSPAIATSFRDSAALPTSPLASLTSRQREILQRMVEGQSTKEIAFELSLSGKTVETHRRQIMERLRVFDVASLVRLALREGLVRTE